MKKIFHTVFRWGNWLFILIMLLAYLAPFIPPKTSWIIAFLGLTFSALSIAFVLITIFGVFLKTKMLWINALVLLLGSPFFIRFYSYAADDATPGNLRVASFNTYALGQYKKLNTSEDIENYLVANNIDCAALIEYRFKKGIISKKNYPYQVKIRLSNKSDNGILIVSKKRIFNSGKVPFSTLSYNMAGFIDVKVNDQNVRIYAVHLETTRLKPRDYHELKTLEFDSKYTESAKSTADRLRKSMVKRAEQVADIKQHISETKKKVILMGDFNDTPQSYAYQQLKDNRNDAFVEVGNGFESTFLKPFPLLRIDYILADKSILCKQYHSTDSIYSDHKLIFADLLIE